MNFIDLKPGISNEGDEVKAFRSEYKSSKYIYLLAGTHGDEVEGVYVLNQLIEWLKDEEDLELPLICIPVLNVDGYRAGTRVNAHGVDLNRNFPTDNWDPKARAEKYNPGKSPLSEPENQYLDKLFSKFSPSIIITFHSWKPMINYNGDCKDIAELLERYNSYPVCDEIKGHPTPGSLGSYAPKKFDCPVLTFECPVISEELTLKNIWEENQIGLKTLMNSSLLPQK